MNLNKILQNHKYQWLQWLQSDSFFSNSLAVVVGILTGILVSFYDNIIHIFSSFIFNSAFSANYYIIFIPAIGGLLVGLISFTLNENRYGIENIIESSTLRGGILKPKSVVLEVFSSIISIGTGGSVGKEAPVALIGAGVGSTLAQFLKLKSRRLKVLFGCGTSAGIAAAFNAPLGGVVFSVEVIFGELESNTFIPLVISAVFSTIIANGILGANPIQLSNYTLINPIQESVLYLLLGFLCALISVLFMRSFYATKDFFSSINIHPILKPGIGGLCVGSIGFFYPQILGVGYESINAALANEISFKLLLILMFLKMIAFSLTLGSGGAGGSLVPSLFIGSMVGGAYGHVVNYLYPDMTSMPGAYALVGMAALFAGISRAPLTAILIIFELTHDYNLVMPVMLAAVASNLTSTAINSESIFTEYLRRRGFTIRRGKEVDIMSSLTVSNAMKKNVHTISLNKKVSSLISLMHSSRHAGFPVMEADGKLWGIVTLKDLRDKVQLGELEKSISEIATPNPIVAYPDQPLDEVLQILAKKDIGRMPVVSCDDKTKLIGIITRSDIVDLYDKTIVERMKYDVQQEQKN